MASSESAYSVSSHYVNCYRRSPAGLRKVILEFLGIEGASTSAMPITAQQLHYMKIHPAASWRMRVYLLLCVDQLRLLCKQLTTGGSPCPQFTLRRARALARIHRGWSVAAHVITKACPTGEEKLSMAQP